MPYLGIFLEPIPATLLDMLRYRTLPQIMDNMRSKPVNNKFTIRQPKGLYLTVTGVPVDAFLHVLHAYVFSEDLFSLTSYPHVNTHSLTHCCA